MNHRVALRLPSLAQIGKTALRIYVCHVLVWTIGVICGVFETFTVLIALGWGPR